MSRKQAEKRKNALVMVEANSKLTDAQKLAKAKSRVAQGMGECAREIARLTKRIEDAKNQAPKKEKVDKVETKNQAPKKEKVDKVETKKLEKA